MEKINTSRIECPYCEHIDEWWVKQIALEESSPNPPLVHILYCEKCQDYFKAQSVITYIVRK